MPLKGHAIWDANQLSAYLDLYSEIRKRFTAFLTPGDVLAELLKGLERRRPNAATILATFLERELRADENSRLDQAGNRTEDQLRLARLFFDLPAFAEQQLEPPREEVNKTGNLPPGVLKELLIAGSRKLDAEAVHIEEVRTDAGTSQPEFHQWYVLFGGPGSGKSTLGQFLGQIHRAALLERRPARTLVKSSIDAITETRDLCERDRLPWPTTPRFPVRVELSRFARKLQETSGTQSFCEYIRESVRGDHSFEHEDFRDWLAAYPWLLILDGLDEVPATSNRDAVIASVRNFLAEARQVEADLFIVATSRQQGYNDEFSESLTAYRHLAPLSKPRALDYVRRYAMAKYGDHQQDARDNLVEKLTRAAERELTARLMATPLQVTFMATVVSAQGEPGEDRWQLFEGYYRTIYDREKQKAVPPFNEVLSNHEGTISRLHYDIGFVLQFEGETSAGSGVTLSLTKFERLVDTYLSGDGYDGEEKKRLVKLIVDAASQRLVFLTSRTKNELAFEVRSLQEFMAAERITTGNEETVEKRLRVIAPIRYWRNVFIIAASKCFRDARSRHLEGKPTSLCEELTRGEPIWEVMRSGPDLALDLLQSGAANRKPSHSRTLTRLAFDLLTEPDFSEESDGLASAAQRLELVLQPFNESLFQEILGRLLGQSDPAMAANAWVLMLRLIGAELEWAKPLAESHWPREVDRQVKLLKLLPESAANCWLHEKIADVVPMVPIDDAKLLTHLLNGEELQPSWLMSVSAIFLKQASGETQLHFAEGMSEGIKIRFIEIEDETSRSEFVSLSELNWQDSSWLPFVLAGLFIQNPSCRSLAQVLRECDSNGWSPKNSYVNVLPWPLGTCLRAAARGKSLKHLATAAENGELGDIDEWKMAEERWRLNGITIEDWTMYSMDDLPFAAGIGLAGFPATSYGASITSRNYSDEVTETLISMINVESNESVLDNTMFFLACINRTSGAVVRRVDPRGCFKT